ncbi:MAG: hypothetical protein ACRCSV_02155 [Chlamydiales bacterium]
MFYKKIIIIVLCFLSSSCRYHFLSKPNISSTVFIPYIEGDIDGDLTNVFIQKITALGYFTPVSENSDFIIQAQVKSDKSDPIGFQFDPKYKEDKRVIPNENRRSIELVFSILSGKTREKLFGPYFIKESIDYDFLDDYLCEDTIQTQQSYLNFSLGQLDNREAAFSTCGHPLFHKVTDRMSKIIFSVLMQSPAARLDKIK